MRLATAMACSGPSQSTARPPSSRVDSISARRGDASTIRVTSSVTASATASSQVTSHASPSGPCSACTTTSMAAYSTGLEPSATTTTSDGPAKLDGTPTTPSPATSRLATAT